MKNGQKILRKEILKINFIYLDRLIISSLNKFQSPLYYIINIFSIFVIVQKELFLFN